MSKLIAPIDDVKSVIEGIEQAREVDDDYSKDATTFTRSFNVFTNGSKKELSVFDVFDVAPSFLPGKTVGSLKINNVRLKQTESNAIYELQVQYVRYELATPFDFKIDWEWESSVLEIPAYTDRNDKPLVTTAGEPIQGLTRRLKLWTLKGTRNVPGVPSWFRDYGVSVNSDTTNVDGEDFKPNELQLQRISLGKWDSEIIDEIEYLYRPLSFEFWFNPLTWSTAALNLGYNELVVTKVVNDKGKTVDKPIQVRATNDGEETKNKVFLDDDGKRPRDKNGNIKTQLDPEDIVVLQFDLDDELPYTPLLT